ASAGVRAAFCVQSGSTENSTVSPSTGCPCASRTRTSSSAAWGNPRTGPSQISVSERCKDTLYPCSDCTGISYCCGPHAVLTHSSIQQKHRVGVDRTIGFLSEWSLRADRYVLGHGLINNLHTLVDLLGDAHPALRELLPG